MPFRLRKSLKIAPGLRLNLSKSGISTSTKVGPVTLNSRGRSTVDLPGTGLFYTSQSHKSTKRANAAASSGCIGCLLSPFRLLFNLLKWLFNGLIAIAKYLLAPARRKITGLVSLVLLILCCCCLASVSIADRLGWIPTLTPTLTFTPTSTSTITPLPTSTLPSTQTPLPTQTQPPSATPLPTSTDTPVPTNTPFIVPTLPANCIAAYPDFCIQPGKRIPCSDLPSNFTVLPPDPFDYDGDGDGRGCEN